MRTLTGALIVRGLRLPGSPHSCAVMLRALALGLPSGWRVASQGLCASTRSFADLNLSDPKVFKKFVGIEDNLGAEADPRGKLTKGLETLLDALKALPEASDYRRVVEATTQYRLKVLQANESNQAVEEVLDAHLEELILECRDELSLVPMMAGETSSSSRSLPSAATFHVHVRTAEVPWVFLL